MIPGVARVNCTGLVPVIEYRVQLNLYFICFLDKNVELVMAFESKHTAREIAANVSAATPFFTLIPVVSYRAPYPRPGLIYPDIRKIRDEIDLRVVDMDTLKR